MGDQGVRGKDSGVFLARLPDVIKTDISVNRMWPFKVGFLTVLFFIFYRWGSVSCREKKWSGCRGWLFPIKTSSPLPAHLILFISSSSFIPDFSGAWYLQHQPFLACPQSCPHSRLSFSFSSFFSFFFFSSFFSYVIPFTLQLPNWKLPNICLLMLFFSCFLGGSVKAQR